MRRMVRRWFQMRADRARARRYIKSMGYDRPLAERAAEAHRLAVGGEVLPRKSGDEVTFFLHPGEGEKA